MNREHWNKLYWRCIQALWRVEDGVTGDSKTARIKAAWLRVMEQRTGGPCFFMRWD